MEEKWVIKSFFKTSIFFFFEPNSEEDMFNSDRIWSNNVWSSTKFDSENQAIKKLNEGCLKYHWGGIYQIEKIYISR